MKTMRAVPALLGLGTLLIAGACVMPDQLSQIQKDLADVRQQLRRVQTDQTQTTRKLEDLEAQAAEQSTRVDRAEIADLALRVDQLAREAAIADERLRDLDSRMDRVARDVDQGRQRSRAESVTSRPLPVPDTTTAPTNAGPGGQASAAEGSAQALPDPEALYNTAYADFSKGNYALAVSGFEEYHEKFPDTALADNALYWVGECHFSQGNFPEAIRAFDGLLENYPDSDKAAAGNLKKAMAFLEQNQIGQAIVQFRYVDSTFPGSDEAKIARDKLTSLGASI